MSGSVLALAWIVASVGSAGIFQPDAQFVSQAIPTILAPGQAFMPSVKMKNTGADAWSGAAGFQLVLQGRPQWGSTAMELVSSDKVEPGAVHAFSTVLVAPDTPGTYPLQWRMSANGAPFGQASDAASVVVRPLPSRDADFVAQTAPKAVAPGEQFTVLVTVRNTGLTRWTEAGGFSLALLATNGVWAKGSVRARLPDSAVVTTGFSYAFRCTLTAPATPGTYTLQWRMSQDGVGLFGKPSPSTTITVRP